MPVEFDPSWEYRVVPEELLEAGLFAESTAPERYEGIREAWVEARAAGVSSGGFRFGTRGSQLHSARMRQRKPPPPRPGRPAPPMSRCPECGNRFEAGWEQIFCSKKCSWRSNGRGRRTHDYERVVRLWLAGFSPTHIADDQGLCNTSRVRDIVKRAGVSLDRSGLGPAPYLSREEMKRWDGCAGCRRPFRKKSVDHVYCSPSCRGTRRARQIQVAAG